MPLLIAATPIGNIEDASLRLRSALTSADVIAAEDTRRLRRLLSSLNVSTSARVISLYDAVEAARVPELIDSLRSGATVVLVSDAGMPLVSDPGFRLVAAATAESLPVSVLPGPSAVLAALAVSGLPVERWCFEGFLPRKPGDRRRRIAALAEDPRAVVLFEAPHRLAVCLRDLSAGFGGDRSAVVCRELTKTYEEILRGTLGSLSSWASTNEVRGEITLVVAGAPVTEVEAPPPERIRLEVDALVAEGSSRRDAIDQVAATLGVSRRVVYAAATRR